MTNIPIHVKALRAEYKRSPYIRVIVKYIRTGYCSYVGKAQRLFKMLCEDYILMDDIWCWAINTQVPQVTGFSPYEMVYHSEPPDLFNFNYKPEQTGINVSTKQYLEQMFKKKVFMDQIVVERKSYEKNTQWIRKLRNILTMKLSL